MKRILLSAALTALIASPVLAEQASPLLAEQASPVLAEEAAPSPLKISMFADAHYNIQTNNNGMGNPWHRAYAQNNGFALSFLGLDATYDAGEFSATTNLRYGTSVPIFYGRTGLVDVSDPSASQAGGVDFISNGAIFQAYASWNPSAVSGLSLDIGRFGTIYGAEVSESWKNLNYTRGGLYYGFQPFWHTGLRVNYQVNDDLAFKALVVNGVNSSIDGDNYIPSIGLQALYSAGPLGVTLGYLGNFDSTTGPANGTASGAEAFDQFVDLVVTLNATEELSFVLNGDFGLDQNRDPAQTSGGKDSAMFYGVSLASGYKFTDMFGIAARGEMLVDDSNALYGVGGVTDAVSVYTGTLTFDFRPSANDNLVIRLDGRFEKASEDIYTDGDDAGTDTWMQAVLGVVVATN